MNQLKIPSIINRRGFSIIEAIASLGIFTATMFVYIYHNTVSSLATVNQRSTVIASIILENVLEDLTMRMPYDTDLQEAFNADHVRYFDQNLRETTPANRKYQLSWIVTEDSPITGNKDISITISWSDNSFTRTLNSRMVR